MLALLQAVVHVAWLHSKASADDSPAAVLGDKRNRLALSSSTESAQLLSVQQVSFKTDQKRSAVHKCGVMHSFVTHFPSMNPSYPSSPIRPPLLPHPPPPSRPPS